MELQQTRVVLADELRFLGDVAPPHVVLMLDANGGIVSWSKAAEALFGWHTHEVIGRGAEMLYAAYRAVEQPTALRRKNGEVFRAMSTVTSLEDASGALCGHVMLIESAAPPRPVERYAPRVALPDRALRSATIGVTVQDGSGRLLYANETAARLCGYASARELIAVPLSVTLARFALLGEDGATFPADLLPGRKVLAGEEPEPALVQVRERATGRRWWVRIFAKAVRNASGHPELAINVWYDVTEEQRRKESVQHLLEVTAALVTTLDFETCLERLADDLVPRLADWCAIDLVENGVRQPLVVRGPDHPKVEMLKALAARRTNAALTTRNVAARLIERVSDADLAAVAPDAASLAVLRSLGLRSAIVVPIANDRRPTGALLLATSDAERTYDHRDLDVARELGERASTLLDNARSYRTALEAVRMRDDFLSIAAHELRTPLASLSLLFESLVASAKRDADPSDLERRLELGMRQVRRLGELIDVLLDIARLTSDRLVLAFERVDVAALVREAAVRSAPEAERSRCELRVACEEVCHAEIDRLRIDQVVSNLIGNALKYGAGHPIDIECRARDGEIHIVVRDEGIGIAPADHERIFRRFERAVGDHHYAGLGLGLWIVREIVAAHGGRIDVTSERGKGATFDVVLPCSRARDLG